MMRLTVNGDAVQLPDGATVTALLERLDVGEGRVAVEVNREIVPRSEHASHVLRENDVVEIVQAIGGG